MAGGVKRAAGRKGGQPGALFYRRSLFLVSYWKDGKFFFYNYLTRKLANASARTAEMLDFFSDWRALRDVVRRWPEYTETSLRKAVGELARETLLDTAGSRICKGSKKTQALQLWGEWNLAAGFFHGSTKDAYLEEITQEEIQHIEGLMELRVGHPVVRKIPAAKYLKLRSVLPASEFAQVLLDRRTWRKFSSTKVPADLFATLLDLSFGVQQWEEVKKVGKLAMKTSPSGGSLHPVDAYVMVRTVAGVAPGIYRYDSGGKGLEEVRRGVSAREIQKYLAGQWWFRDASFVVFLTAVFGRTQWKYDYARAYRAILLEAGHLCQTFCLTATWLGLAPFCTLALADTAIEKALRVDGIAESVIYAMGAGGKPSGATS